MKPPLAGVRVVEFAGLGPAPFACMLLSDLGADIATVDRPGAPAGDAAAVIGRGRRVLRADLKHPDQRARVLALLERADVLVEGFRPGVMERLGLGPEAVHDRNPRLVYARMTGWGQQGPLAATAGHDINYIALAGALHAIGPAGGDPLPPLNLVGDYGGGSLYLVVGILAALLEAQRSGQGQVVDAAITDGTLSLMSLFTGLRARGLHAGPRGGNLLDGGAPYYATYATADGKHVAVGCLEPQFFQAMCERIGVRPELRQAQHDRAQWPALRAELARIFAGRTRADWEALLAATDACVTPVLDLQEALAHPHHRARAASIELGGLRQPAPAPRLSRTPARVQGAARDMALDEVLQAWPARASP